MISTMLIAHMRLGFAAWRLLPDKPYQYLTVVSHGVDVPTDPNITQARGSFLTQVSHELLDNFPRRMALFFRIDHAYVLELPLIQVKKIQEPPIYQAQGDEIDFPLIPLLVEFYGRYPHRPLWHEWRSSLRELVNLRLEDSSGDSANLRKVELDELRHLLGKGSLPEGEVAIHFDAEGGIRPPGC